MDTIKRMFQLNLREKESVAMKRAMALVMIPIFVLQMCSLNLLLTQVVRAEDGTAVVGDSTTADFSPKTDEKEILPSEPKEKADKTEASAQPVVEENANTGGETAKDVVEATPAAASKEEASIEASTEATKVTEKPAASSEAISKDEVNKPEWIMSDDGKIAEIGPVEPNVTYKAPQDEGVTVTFTKLPDNPGSLKIEEITLTDEQIGILGALSDKAYDITSDMKNGTFEYDLTLPKPKNADDAQISYIEKSVDELDEVNSGDIKNIDEDKTEVKDDNVKANGIDHFTPFLLTPVTKPDLIAVKTNNVSGNATVNVPFVWTIRVSNSGTASATFASGRELLKDEMPDDYVGAYSQPTLLTSGTTGIINCTTSGSWKNENLSCKANGLVTMPAESYFDVSVTVNPTTAGKTLTNPHSGKTCKVDPGSTVTESNETDNTCSDTVAVLNAGSITIFEDSVPEDIQGFEFNGGILGNFTLDDDNIGNNNNKVFSNLMSGTYTITESAAFGWDLTSITCNEGGSANISGRNVVINLAAGKNIICTFVNTKEVNTYTVNTFDSGSYNTPKNSFVIGEKVYGKGMANNPYSYLKLQYKNPNGVIAKVCGGYYYPSQQIQCDYDLPPGAQTGTWKLELQAYVFLGGWTWDWVTQATANFSVAVPNHAPVANGQSISTNENTAKEVTLDASDADNDALAYAVVTPPSHGVLSGTAPDLTYTPDVDYSGSDSFTFKANDGKVDSSIATVSIAIIDNIAPAVPAGIYYKDTVNNKNVLCGQSTSARNLDVYWNKNTESDFAYYEYISFNADGTTGPLRTFTEPYFNASWWTVPMEGVYGVQIRAVDNAGNKSDWFGGTQGVENSCQYTADWTVPTATVSYSTTDPTNGNVVATLNPSEPVTVTNNGGNATYTFSNNGTFTFEFVDATGNTGTAIATVDNIDKTLPVVSLTSPLAGLVSGTVDIRGTVIEKNPYRYWLAIYKGSSEVYSTIVYHSDEFTDRSLYSWDTTGVADGNYQIRFAERDINDTGNRSLDFVVNVTVDNTHPTTPVITTPGNGSYFKTTPIRNEWTASTDASSIKEYRVEYIYDDGHTFSGGPYRIVTTTWRNHVPSLSEQGGVTIRVQALDNAGNYSGWSEPVHYFYDATAPVLASQTTFSGWYNSVQTSTFHYTDANLADGYVDPTCNIATEGANQICSTVPNVCDKAGNCNTTPVTSNGANIDLTLPDSTITSPSGGTGNIVYIKDWDGSIAGTASDSLSGVARVKLSIQEASKGYWTGSGWQVSEFLLDTAGTNPWTYSGLTAPAEGTYTIKSHAVDNAGNMENTAELTIVFDKTIPEVSLSIDPKNPNGDNDWYDSHPEITLNAADANLDRIEYQIDSTSGTWIAYSSPIKIDDGKHVFYYRSWDKAGNESAAGVKNVKVDTEDPDEVKNVKASYSEDINAIKLNWKVDDSDISDVYIYRGKSKNFKVNGSSRIGKNDNNDENFTDYDVKAGEKYYYKFVALDEAGNRSGAKIVSVEILEGGGGVVVTDEGTEALPQGTVIEEGQPQVSGSENSGGRVAGAETSNENPKVNVGWPWWWIVVLLIVLAGGIWWWQRKKNKEPKMPE